MIRASHYGQRLMIALCLGITVIAAGCGGRSSNLVDTPLATDDTSLYYQDDIYTLPSADPLIDASPTPTPTPTASATPAPTPTPSASPTSTPSASPTPTPTATPTPMPTSGITLTAEITDISYPGIALWEKVEIIAQVKNPSLLRTQVGKLNIAYTLKGQLVETQIYGIVLAPGEIRNYGPFRSKEHADAAQVSITP